MTENANLTKALLDRITALKGHDSLFTSTKVSSISMGEDNAEGSNLSNWPVLSLQSALPSSSPSKIAARLLVGADGFNSPVRTFSGIASSGWDYARHGVVATLKIRSQESTFDEMLIEDDAVCATAYQRFLPELGGPIALLPLPGNYASLVWSTTPANAAYLQSLPAPSFVATVNAALRLSQSDIKYMFSLPSSEASAHDSELRWRLEHTLPPPLGKPLPFVEAVQTGSIASFPLRFRHAKAITAPRIALAGDAAHTIHPLAGQGLNLGLGDACVLADTIAYGVEHGMDIGDLMTLEKYGGERFSKGMKMGFGVDALNWCYQVGNGEGPLGTGVLASLASRARGLGMSLIDKDLVPGLKSLVMRQAEG